VQPDSVPVRQFQNQIPPPFPMVSSNRALAVQTTGRPMAVTGGRPSCCRARPCVGRRQAGPGPAASATGYVDITSKY
jgi:hypothetical protein